MRRTVAVCSKRYAIELMVLDVLHASSNTMIGGSMKFAAISLLAILSQVANAATVIDCSRPPGGQIRCPDTFVAVCNVRAGAVFGECMRPPASPRDREGYIKQLLEKSSGLDRPLKAQELDTALATGEYRNTSNGVTTRF